jgi:hypothetical protein
LAVFFDITGTPLRVDEGLTPITVPLISSDGSCCIVGRMNFYGVNEMDFRIITFSPLELSTF